MSILIAILIIIAAILFIKKLPVIAIAVVFGAIIIFMSVWILRNVVHVPIDDYVNLEKVDYATEKVKLKSDDDIVAEKVANQKTDYDSMSEEELKKILENIEKIEKGEPAELLAINDENSKGTTHSNSSVAKMPSPESIEKTKVKNVDETETYRYLFKDYPTNKSRKRILKEHSSHIKDKKFETKLMGMSSYVALEYDLGNATLSTSEDYKEFIISYKKR